MTVTEQGHDRFHRLVQITKPANLEFYWAVCEKCRKYGLYKDLRQQHCWGVSK